MHSISGFNPFKIYTLKSDLIACYQQKIGDLNEYNRFNTKKKNKDYPTNFYIIKL